LSTLETVMGETFARAAISLMVALATIPPYGFALNREAHDFPR